MQTSRTITFIIVFVIFLGSAAGLLIPRQAALGQASASTWTDPVNLSNSGGASNPVMVVDSQGRIHVLWEDQYAKFVYARSDDGQTWLDLVALDLPFYGLPYQLLADDNNQIFAFWLDEDGKLWESHVDAVYFADPGLWSEARILTNDAVRFDAAIDSAQRIHVVYLQAVSLADSPSGVYVLNSGQNGQGWSAGVPVYQSQYLRNLQDNRQSTRTNAFDLSLPARVDIDVTDVDGQPQLFVAWDNPVLKRVFFTRSLDEGKNWDPETLVDGPTFQFPYLSPISIHVHANGSNILLVWDNNDGSAECTHRFQISTDGGISWSSPADLLSDSQVCLSSYQLMTLPNGQALLFGAAGSQTFLMVWNGNVWSTLQEQSPLMNLVDPLSFAFIQPGCQSASLVESTLWMVNCDQGSGGDIWIESRSIDNTDELFPTSQRWTTMISQELDPVSISSIAAIAQPDGSVFAFWSEPDTAAIEKTKTNLFLSRWNGKEFSGVYPVIEGLVGVANQLTIADGNNNRLYLVWSGGLNGQVQVSWANQAEASSPSSWSEPKSLQADPAIGWYPSLSIDPSGDLVLAYAVPLNEQRGVYLMRSSDGGQTWAEPEQVFDAAANDCALVEQPHLAITTDRQYNLMWTCSTAPGGVGPHDLYAVHSSDAGLTWGQVEPIISQPVYWNALTAYGSTVYRVWKEIHDGKTMLFFAFSTDGGGTWSLPDNLWTSTSAAGLTSLVEDSGGQLHLVQVVQDQNDTPKMLYFRLESGTWIPDDALDLPVVQVSDVTSLGLAVDASQHLVVVTTILGQADGIGNRPHLLNFYSKAVSVPEDTAPPVMAVSPQDRQTPTDAGSEIAPTPIVTPTAIVPGTLGNPGNSGGNTTMGLVIGSMIALVIIGGVTVFNIFRARQDHY